MVTIITDKTANAGVLLTLVPRERDYQIQQTGLAIEITLLGLSVLMRKAEISTEF